MLLELNNLTAYYGKALALEQVSVGVRAGELLAVIGPNGAGKTTLLRTISGLIPLTEGEIVFQGQKITTLKTHEIVRRGLIHCPEGRRPFPEMTVQDNLLLGTMWTKEQHLIQERFEYVYELFPILKERSKQLAGTMSGGQQQMLAIGRAMMLDPKLLLLDEPSIGLAPKVVDEIFETVKMIKESGVTILLVEQNVDIAISVADRLAVLDHGRVVFSGVSSDLLANSDLREVYLGIA